MSKPSPGSSQWQPTGPLGASASVVGERNSKHEQLIKLGGTESVEVVNWLAMRGALPLDAKPVVEAYYAHRIMGYGLQTFEVAA